MLSVVYTFVSLFTKLSYSVGGRFQAIVNALYICLGIKTRLTLCRSLAMSHCLARESVIQWSREEFIHFIGGSLIRPPSNSIQRHNNECGPTLLVNS